MKKLLIATMLITLPMTGCFGDTLAKEDTTMKGLGFVEESTIKSVTIYQHKLSGNCYAYNYYVQGGSISQVVCSDFGILSSEEIKQNSLQEKRNKLEIERQKYLQMKRKFESIDCKSVDEDGDGFSKPCPDVDDWPEDHPDTRIY